MIQRVIVIRSHHGKSRKRMGKIRKTMERVLEGIKHHDKGINLKRKERDRERERMNHLKKNQQMINRTITTVILSVTVVREMKIKEKIQEECLVLGLLRKVKMKLTVNKSKYFV